MLSAYRGFWQDAENLKSFFDELAPTVGVRQVASESIEIIP